LDVGSCFNASAMDDMNGVARESKCHYFKGCISEQRELVRMEQAIAYKDINDQVKIVV
jgi:hypothetical protein